MTKTMALSFLALAAASLTAGAGGAQPPGIRVRVLLPAYRQAIAIDTIMFVTDQEAPAAKVWAAAAKVFYDYKIANPNLALWEIGNSVPGVLRVQKIKSGDDREELLLKKRALAATVSRYMRRANAYINNLRFNLL